MNIHESQNIDKTPSASLPAPSSVYTRDEGQKMGVRQPVTTEGAYYLKDRREAIIPLANHFIKLSDEQLGTGHKTISKEAEDYLLSYDWPGEEKELESTIKKACILSDGPLLNIEDFDLKQRQARSIGKFVEARLKGFMQNIKRLEKFNLYEMVIPEVEKSLINMVMKETEGNQIKAARLLGINRNTLRMKLTKLGIKPKD